MNLVCSNETSKCECRDDMRWSKENIECQIYIAVDCSIFEYANEYALKYKNFNISDILPKPNSASNYVDVQESSDVKLESEYLNPRWEDYVDDPKGATKAG